MKKIITIIPARLASTRLPNKPLADIAGKPMIVRVYEQALKANLGEVLVACDSLEIKQEIENIGGKAIITDINLPSGTDRIFAALKKHELDYKYDIVVNLQGDLPEIDPEIIKAAANSAIKGDEEISTIASIIESDAEKNNPNSVKIAISFDHHHHGRALYFSRTPIPYGMGEYYHHIGIYAYKRDALERFVNLKPSILEEREKLEQLRALENNMKIAVQIVNSHPISVDTKQDLEKVRNLFAN